MKSRMMIFAGMLARTCALLVGLFVLGCEAQSLEEFASSSDGAFASTALEEFRVGKLSALKDKLHPELQTPSRTEQLVTAVERLPLGTPLEVNLVGYRLNTVNLETDATVTYQYRFASGWWLGTVAFTRGYDERRVITSLNLQGIKVPLQELNSFGFSRAKAAHYLFLFATFATVMFTLVTFVVCLRTPMFKRKWLWALFIVSIGVCRLNFDWSTGEFTTELLRVDVPFVSYSRSGPYAPWVVRLGLPVGALLFWNRRRWFIEEHARWTNARNPDGSARAWQP